MGLISVDMIPQVVRPKHLDLNGEQTSQTILMQAAHWPHLEKRDLTPFLSPPFLLNVVS